MDIVNRLKEYMDYLGMPSTQFADRADIARPTLSQILNGRNRKISNELLDKLHRAYPSLNIMWLLFGDGDIEINANKQTSERQKTPDLFSITNEAIGNQTANSEYVPRQNERLPLRNSTIDEFMAENLKSQQSKAETMAQTPGMPVGTSIDPSKRIKSIMVFFSDSSYEIFTPQ